MTTTPRPWHLGMAGYVIGNGEIVAVCQSYHCDEWEANAALIVHAVNTHDRAKAALQLAFDCGYSNALAAGQTDAYVKNEPWYKKAKALLADMEG